MINLELRCKANSSIIDMREIDCDSVPRVGEVISVGNEIKYKSGEAIEPCTFFVCDVTWIVENGRLAPYVRARQCLAEPDRKSLLEEDGWL